MFQQRNWGGTLPVGSNNPVTASVQCWNVRFLFCNTLHNITLIIGHEFVPGRDIKFPSAMYGWKVLTTPLPPTIFRIFLFLFRTKTRSTKRGEKKSSLTSELSTSTCLPGSCGVSSEIAVAFLALHTTKVKFGNVRSIEPENVGTKTNFLPQPSPPCAIHVPNKKGVRCATRPTWSGHLCSGVTFHLRSYTFC